MSCYKAQHQRTYKLNFHRYIMRKKLQVKNMEIKPIKQFYPKNRSEWRKWLQKNHRKEKAVALIRYKKHTGVPSPTVQEAMHEAICFGWIDTTLKRIDNERYLINYRKRNEKTAKWSKNTLSYAKQLIKEGLMAPEGLRLYKIGLNKLPHDHGIPNNPRIPLDLKEELLKYNLIKQFKELSPSSKRTYLRGLYRAKQTNTRIKRIKEIIKIIKN